MNEAELATLDNSSRGDESHLSPVTFPDTNSGGESLSAPSLAPPSFPNGNHHSATQAAVSHEEAVAQPDLITACQDGDFAAVKRLANADNIDSGALHHAASNNHWRIATFLIAKGADVNLKIEPLDAPPMLWACRNGHAYLVKLLIDHGADTSVVDSSGFSALHLAVHSSNVLMVAYIIHLEVDVDKLDVGHRTALHWAIVQGDHLSVEALLKAGASSNLPDGEGASPLSLEVNTSKSDHIVSMLLEYGADPSAVDLGQSTVPLAWTEGCRLAGRLPNGQVYRNRYFTAEVAKILTFMAPFVVIPVAFFMPHLLGGWLLGIPAIVAVGFFSRLVIAKYLISYGWHGDRAMMQSTLFAGIFMSIYCSIALFWFCELAPLMFVRRPWSSFYLVFSLIIITTSYLATMLMDPGKIEPKSLACRLTAMNRLMDLGLFDSGHLCLHTYVAIPARARYDIYLDRVVCRFDHYCPWLYNTIGLRNHRSFLVFLLSLGCAMPVAYKQYREYVRDIGASYFSTLLFMITAFQSFWIYVLTLVQLTQISRAATSHEITHHDQLYLFRTDPIQAYSSLPRDHPMAAEILGDTTSASSLLKHNCADAHRHGHHSKGWLCCRVTGLSQVLEAFRALRHPDHYNAADHGLRRNCMDFWLGGGNPIHPDGTFGLIDGTPVDYSKLEFPLKTHPYEA